MVQLWHLSPTDTKPDLHKSYATIMEKKVINKTSSNDDNKEFSYLFGKYWKFGTKEF
jgi:hypothetical protein